MEKKSGEVLDRREVAIAVEEQLNRLSSALGMVSFLSTAFRHMDDHYTNELKQEDLDGASSLLCHIAHELSEIRQGLRPLAEDGEEVAA